VAASPVISVSGQRVTAASAAIESPYADGVHVPEGWNWDPTLFKGSAAYYDRGRLPYAPGYAEALAAALALDGRGRLLVIGDQGTGHPEDTARDDHVIFGDFLVSHLSNQPSWQIVNGAGLNGRPAAGTAGRQA
jgi:hypothetical protein